MTGRPPAVTVASVLGAVGSAGTSALAALCCVGPLAYGVLGAGGVLAAARLAPWRPWLLVGSAIFLAVGFWTAYRPLFRAANASSCPVRAGRAVRIILWIAAALTITAIVAPELLT
jgi:MerT mercuric transport protein